MHSYASLVHTLGCIDSHASIRILESLRLGEYDLALLGSSHTSQATASIDSVYPWEDFPIEYQHQSEPNSNILPSIYTSLSVRYTGATYSAMLTNRSRRSDENMLRKVPRMIGPVQDTCRCKCPRDHYTIPNEHAATL